jgi:hypothetical protein
MCGGRKALETFKQRIRELTRRSGGRSLPEVANVCGLMPGWKAYFQLAQTPKVFRELDEWIRTGCVRCSSSTGVVARRCIGN